ncbi:hypothetical protein [Mesorhizobium sp. WSM4884]|uniref:hypothetical protein n=1 Tax=Mesorhizobium sp. WSM4884 TaxID=3038542 RepID=UPI0024175E76|nr:hypothetical protein [Mesorhizobium sp. WSM4884]MDG4881622.1 hypothetical protein [Mesorhizobium sp. WSM4884]
MAEHREEHGEQKDNLPRPDIQFVELDEEDNGEHGAGIDEVKSRQKLENVSRHGSARQGYPAARRHGRPVTDLPRDRARSGNQIEWWVELLTG